MKPVKVLFVCLGNICRSPTAHGIFRSFVREQGLHAEILVDSAGTSGWHIGSPPDQRSAAAAAKRGYDLSDLRGRQVGASDFLEYDYILAMDSNNLSALKAMKPSYYEGTLSLFLDFAENNDVRDVPDPYYGGVKGFDKVLDLVEDGCAGLLAHIRQNR
ncbi:protein tyrosine phosphatase [Alteromonadaceae bacterium Bs31]|nr:protein tyrosine phosphatase [Alteromonadaceae bacterium Bs31]